jgi:DNA-binding IclR family transcriptional regulator
MKGWAVTASDPAGGSARYRVEAVSRAAQLLTALRRAPGSSPQALAAIAETPLTFTETALKTLERQGLVRRIEDGSWALGLSWLRLADVKRRQLDLRDVAGPIMRRMRDDVDETVILAIRRGDRRVNIDYVESTQAIRRITQFGFEMPLHIGATGRVLLCTLSHDELGEYFATLATNKGRAAKLLDIDRYMADVAMVRKVGHFMARGEITADTASVSAPVRDHTGAVIAALTVSAPADRFSAGLEKACIESVHSGAADLSRLLGYVEPETAPLRS